MRVQDTLKVYSTMNRKECTAEVYFAIIEYYVVPCLQPARRYRLELHE